MSDLPTSGCVQQEKLLPNDPIVPELTLMLSIWCLRQQKVILASHINLKLQYFFGFPSHRKKIKIILLTVIILFTLVAVPLHLYSVVTTLSLF